MTRPTPQRGERPQPEQPEQAAPPAPPPPGTTGATSTTGDPTPQPAPLPPPPGRAMPPTQRPASSGVGYTQADLEAAASRMGCHAWDVAGIFFAKHVERMSQAEFDAALKEWRTPIRQRQEQAQKQQPSPRQRQRVPRTQPGPLSLPVHSGTFLQGYFGSPGLGLSNPQLGQPQGGGF